MSETKTNELSLRVCAEKDCGDVPTVRLVLADGVGEFDLAFACSTKHLEAITRATRHLVEKWYPLEFTRTVRPLDTDPDEAEREAGVGSRPLL